MTDSHTIRTQLKEKARALCAADNRAMMMLTMVFLMLTSWLTLFLRLMEENPLILIMDDLSERLSSLMNSAADLSAIDPTSAYLGAFQMGKELFAKEGTFQLVFAYVLLFLCAIVLRYGFYHCCLVRVRGRKVSAFELIDGYYYTFSALLLEFVTTALVLMGFSCFFFPGVYLYYRYALSGFCLVDHPEEGVLGAMRRSARISRKHKIELFQCDFSFVGWALASSIAGELCANLGALVSPNVASIAFLFGTTLVSRFLMPYRHMTLAGYYDHLNGTEEAA